MKIFVIQVLIIYLGALSSCNLFKSNAECVERPLEVKEKIYFDSLAPFCDSVTVGRLNFNKCDDGLSYTYRIHMEKGPRFIYEDTNKLKSEAKKIVEDLYMRILEYKVLAHSTDFQVYFSYFEKSKNWKQDVQIGRSYSSTIIISKKDLENYFGYKYVKRVGNKYEKVKCDKTDDDLKINKFEN